MPSASLQLFLRKRAALEAAVRQNCLVGYRQALRRVISSFNEADRHQPSRPSVSGRHMASLAPGQVQDIVRTWSRGNGRLVVLTGSGVSAASGIPTFRGPEGYWTVGSDVYRPEEMATRRSFRKMPEDLWQWYLYRRGVCRGAEPNAAHHALVAMQQLIPDRMILVTQNVDGLHRRAGSAAGPYIEIHGTLEHMRCMACDADPVQMPPELTSTKGAVLTQEQQALLKCRTCGGWMRPHVLWFDESYDDRFFPLDRALQDVAEASLVITAGTSGGTNLPWLIAKAAETGSAFLIDINPQPSPFVLSSVQAAALRGGAEEWLPKIVEWIESGRAWRNGNVGHPH